VAASRTPNPRQSFDCALGTSVAERWRQLSEEQLMRSLSLIEVENTAKVPLYVHSDTYEQVRRTLDDALAELESEITRDESERD
jgi:hypothetical protein